MLSDESRVEEYMKRNLVSRIVTAVAIAGIGAALTACGSSNNGGAVAVGGGYGGGSFVAGAAAAGVGTPYCFTGLAQIDQSETGVIAAPQMLSLSESPTTSTYEFGQTAQLGTLAFNLANPVMPNYPGTTTQIQGCFQFNQQGYSIYEQEYGGVLNVIGIGITGNGSNLGIGTTQNPNPAEYGPFQYAVFSGYVVLYLATGQQIPIQI
jgi:hypothetical protein